MKRFLVVLTALLLVFAFIGCNSDSIPPNPATTAKYVFNDDDFNATLVIKDSAAKVAAYNPKSGDSYEFTWTDKEGRKSTSYVSTGTIASFAGGKFTLSSIKGSNFTVKVDGNSITEIEGDIVFDKNYDFKMEEVEWTAVVTDPWIYDLGAPDDGDPNRTWFTSEADSAPKSDLTPEIFQKAKYAVIVAKGTAYGIGGMNFAIQVSTDDYEEWRQVNAGNNWSLGFLKEDTQTLYSIVKLSNHPAWADAKNADALKLVVQDKWAGGAVVQKGYLTNVNLVMPEEDSVVNSGVGWFAAEFPELKDEKITLLPAKK